jgi:hypothetical protein
VKHVSIRDRFGHRYPDGEHPNDMIRSPERVDRNPFDADDHHWQPHDPTYDNRRYDDGEWWNWPVLIILVLVTSWTIFSGWRGVALALIFVIGVTILVIERTGTWVVAITTIVLTLLIAAIYFHIAWQSL